MSARLLPLTRTACLRDFPGCASAAMWQQALALEAYQRWIAYLETTDPAGVLCLNWGSAHFRAPGPDPIYAAYGEPVTPNGPIAALFALSVLDRVEQPLRLLRQLTVPLVPGGLVVCTFAAWDAAGGADCAHGHELRRRIFDHDMRRDLVEDIKRIGLRSFGGVDLHYYGDLLGDHTLASLVALKGRRDG